MCWPTATAEWGQRRLERRYKNVKREESEGLHPLDGVRVFAADQPPEVDPFA